MDDGPRRICLPLSFSLSFSLFSKVGLCVRRRQAAAAAGGGDGGGAVAFHQSLNRNELATLKMIETHTQTALPVHSSVEVDSRKFNTNVGRLK